MFDEVGSQVSFPELERGIISFWQENHIFRRSLEKPAPRGRYTFYEGPPTANGKPGVHHVISRAFKDLFPRYKTMRGYRVDRKGGWDTHGLPVEIAIEKRLGFSSKQQIEEYGIEAFNSLCREYVFENIQDWNEMTERIGFWLDLDNAYVTYDNDYIESCWWVMKQLWDRGLLIEDYKTTWHSPSSNTTLASHEVSLGQKEDVEDPSVYPKFPADSGELKRRGLLAADENRPVFFVAWTTTPWTLAANSGLAVHPEADYALVAAPENSAGAAPEQLMIVARTLVAEVFGDTPHEVIGTFSGTELAGVRYEPLLRGAEPPEGLSGDGWRVVLDGFVTLDDGSGIVHLAPAYGDLDLGRSHDLPTVLSVALTGEVLPEVRFPDSDEIPGPYSGMWFKDADALISDDLHARGLLFRRGTILHMYPFNWRDDKPLMNVAKKSWYIRTTALKQELLANNERVNWYPEHIGSGRFGRWLENNVDWALSRERFWGAPLPIWRSDDGDTICVGSVAELSRLAGRDLSALDLHRPFVDEVEFESGGKRYRREPFTVDVWFESGAMPYAQWHYLGSASSAEEQANLAANFPADYICEAIDQTRGWFYSLHALATLLSDSGDPEEGRPPGPLAPLQADTSAFRNVIVLGHIVDEQGQKMSKSVGNVVDPWEVLDTSGADALRWYMFSSSPPEATKRFSAALVEETLRDFFMTLWNSYSFFVLYANLDRPDLEAAPPPAERPAIDRWLLARLAQLVRDVTAALEGYDPTTASRALRDFVVDDLSNWYVRRNRGRFWKSSLDGDKTAAYATMYGALVTVAKLMAPFAPFVSEEIYQNLVRKRDGDAPLSVHLAAWPEVDTAAIDEALLRDMEAVVRLVELGRSARAASGHKVRQPLPEVLVRVRSEAELAGIGRLEDQLLEELNVKRVTYLDIADPFVDYSVKPNLPLIGKRLGRLVPAFRAALERTSGREIAANVRAGTDTVLELEGEAHSFEPEAFLLDAHSPDGYAAAEERGYLVALDTRLTPELEREGMARDLIRLVQNARKNAGLEVSDRIRLGIEGDDDVAAVLEAFGDTVRSVVLAEQLESQLPEDAEHSEQVEFDGRVVRIGLSRL